VLLNSDTVVPNHWLDRLVGQAYSAGQVGTVTPFSNNATICNFPTLQGFSQLPADQTVDQISEACSEANLGRSVEIPTAVGFCMYIRRDCLTDVGLFDIAAFGKGYGEENDFCLKATAKGWKHLLATDAFVFHEGEASFQSESSPGKKAAAKVIRERYPYYEDLVAQHVTADLAAPYRIAASASLLKRSRQPVILLITHILAGGTERHIQELIRELGSRVQFLILRPTAEPYESSDVSLELTSAGERLQFVVAGQARDKFLKEYLSACGVKRVHLHHTMGFRNSILSLIETLGIPYDVTVHDYLAICPQIHLNDKNGSYCGEPGQDGCVDCLRERPAAGVYDITWWRLRHKTLLKRAERVICPTNDVAERLSRYFPGLNYLVVPHENPASRGRMSVEAPKKGGSLRIAVLGVLSPTKGAKTVEQLVMAVQEQNLPIHLTVIGSLAEEPRKRIERYITHTGGYPDGELETLLDSVDPHIIWFPARVPETYSYTLSTALRSGRPIVAARLGAFIERCADDPWTWLVDWNASQDDILALFQEIVSQLENSRALPIAREQQDNSTPTLADFYHHDYLLPLEMSQSREIHDLRTSAITAVVLPELMGGSPSPCSFIRLLLPLTHDAVSREDLEVLVLSLEESLKCKSDVLIVNRLSVGDIYAVDSLLTHCRNNGIKVVYELDDDIFLMGGHSEQAHYTAGMPAALRLLIGADEVWVSTPILKERLSCLNGHIRVFLNALDERLWLDHHDSVKVFPRQLSRVTRLVYMGTRTHNAELELISPALERLKKEFGPKIDIQLIGVAVEGDSIPWWATLVNVPSFPGGSYPAFVRWLCEKRPYDIGLCPLVESAFNEGKSAIKILDYLALGATPICSAVEPYASTILNASTPDLAGTPIALAVPNSTEAWYQALKELIEQPELQASILARGRNWLLSEGILKVTAPDRVVALQELVSRTTTRQDTIEVLQNPEKDQQLLDRFGDYKLRRILSASYLVGEGIEVGALQNPLPVTARATVKYVDRLRREDLYREYPELRDQNVVDPDIVDNGETLATVPSASLDFVIANHFLEHCENPLLALENFLRVLRPGGTIFLALPDKRFTFDRDRQTTDLAHVVNDYLQGPEQSRSVHYREWAEFVEPHFGRVYTAGEALEERAHQLMTQQYSVHFHNWTPIEVCDILNFARKELDFPLMVEFFFSYSEEMILILRKSALNTVDSPEMAPLSSIPEREELLVAGAG